MKIAPSLHLVGDALTRAIGDFGPPILAIAAVGAMEKLAFGENQHAAPQASVSQSLPTLNN